MEKQYVLFMRERASLDYIVVPPKILCSSGAFRAQYYPEDEAHITGSSLRSFPREL
ncbi:hypothetical protein Dimus_034546, partial [Dionaea muscipula]